MAIHHDHSGFYGAHPPDSARAPSVIGLNRLFCANMTPVHTVSSEISDYLRDNPDSRTTLTCADCGYVQGPNGFNQFDVDHCVNEYLETDDTKKIVCRWQHRAPLTLSCGHTLPPGAISFDWYPPVICPDCNDRVYILHVWMDIDPYTVGSTDPPRGVDDR